MHMEVTGFFGRFVRRGINIYDVTIHPSRGLKINPTLKVCEQPGCTRFREMVWLFMVALNEAGLCFREVNSIKLVLL